MIRQQLRLSGIAVERRAGLQGKRVVSVRVVVRRQRQLLQVIFTLRPTCRLTSLLHGREQQCDENCDDCDNHQQLYQSDAAITPELNSSHDTLSFRLISMNVEKIDLHPTKAAHGNWRQQQAQRWRRRALKGQKQESRQRTSRHGRANARTGRTRKLRCAGRRRDDSGCSRIQAGTETCLFEIQTRGDFSTCLKYVELIRECAGCGHVNRHVHIAAMPLRKSGESKGFTRASGMVSCRLNPRRCAAFRTQSKSKLRICTFSWSDNLCFVDTIRRTDKVDQQSRSSDGVANRTICAVVTLFFRRRGTVLRRSMTMSATSRTIMVSALRLPCR